VAEAAEQLADGLRPSAGELGKHVRLGLCHAEVARRPLDVLADQVDSPLQLGNHSDMGYYDTGMTDETLLAAFEAGTLEASDFPHEAHVRVTWLLVQRDGCAAAYERLSAGIQGIARRAGRPEAFHETITRAWFELIAAAAEPDDHLELFDRGLLRRYYSAAALAAGRERWVEPDLSPLRLPPPPGR
jgi:hypothetical protein